METSKNKATGGHRRLRWAVDCSHDPELYERITKAALKNFNVPTLTRGLLGKFTLKVLRKFVETRGSDVSDGL